MDIEYRKFQETDFFKFDSMPDDKWKSTSIKIANDLCETPNSIEQCYVALIDDKIIGFIYGFALPSKILIPELLYVIPEYRKCGVGSHLLCLLEEESACENAMIFYNCKLHDYYFHLGYSTGENLEVAMKDLPKRNNIKE